MAFNKTCKCGEVDNYLTVQKSNNKTAYCNNCGEYMGNVPYSDKKPAIYYNSRGSLESYPETVLRETYEEFKENPNGKFKTCNPKFILIQEYKVVIDTKTMYIDFCEPSNKIAVEIDSYEYHERTKEQIEKTINRQNKLTVNGFNVLRFTGSQINLNPVQVISDIYKFYCDLEEKK